MSIGTCKWERKKFRYLDWILNWNNFVIKVQQENVSIIKQKKDECDSIEVQNEKEDFSENYPNFGDSSEPSGKELDLSSVNKLFKSIKSLKKQKDLIFVFFNENGKYSNFEKIKTLKD